jgi:hypothetical protein
MEANKMYDAALRVEEETRCFTNDARRAEQPIATDRTASYY